MTVLSHPLRWKIAIETARGVEYLHNSLKIVHGNLNSNNILLDKDYHPKITDSGLISIRLECTIITKGKSSSIRWNAPELFVDGAQPTFASDVFSFGLLWELTSRKILFADVADETIATQIADGLKEHLEESPEVPQIFNSLIQECWNTDPKKRPSITAIAESLEKEKSTTTTPTGE
jgi:serine/threonine protein kinase